MLDQHKQEFSGLMDSVLPIYRMEASKNTKRIWWEVLKRFTMGEVAAAFGEHVSKNSRGITPADIVALIDAANPDGRLGPDEAWAMMPYQDEASSVVMTQEMAEAFGIANEVDDKNGARMAFREAYNRIVARNKRAGINPEWFPCFGHDKNGREIALKEAARLGRLPEAQVLALLPPPMTEQGLNILRLVAPEENEAPKFDVGAKIEQLKSILNCG